jgi:hypothetical protein
LRFAFFCTRYAAPAAGLAATGHSFLMIGMVLVTHGRLATEFRAALEHVVGPQAQLETIASGFAIGRSV